MATYDARDLNLDIDKSVLKSLYQRQSYRHLMALIMNWVIIISTIYLCVQFFNPLLYILALLIIGARMHAMAILMHDATHYRFLKNRKWNDWISNFGTMYFIFSSIEVYRKNHLKHHLNLNTDDDPDWFFKLGRKDFTFPKTKTEFLLTVFGYFTLVRGFMDAIWFLKRFAPAESKLEPSTAKKKAKMQSKIMRLTFYIVLVAALSVFGLWKIFALYWVVPYLSTFFMFQYIRSVSEHFGELEYDHLLTSTRTMKVSPIEEFFFAPHNVGYHLEHHLYPGVPYYNLPKLHNLLMEKESYSSKAHITRGYWGGLLQELTNMKGRNTMASHEPVKG